MAKSSASKALEKWKKEFDPNYSKSTNEKKKDNKSATPKKEERVSLTSPSYFEHTSAQALINTGVSSKMLSGGTKEKNPPIAQLAKNTQENFLTNNANVNSSDPITPISLRPDINNPFKPDINNPLDFVRQDSSRMSETYPYMTKQEEDIITSLKEYDKKKTDEILSMSSSEIWEHLGEGKNPVAYITADGYAIKWNDLYKDTQMMERTQSVLNAADFETKSKYKKKDAKYDMTWNGIPVIGNEFAHLYNYINGDKDSKGKATILNERQVGMSDFGKYALLTDDERRAFNYIANTEGEKAAMEYLDLFDSKLRERRVEHENKETKEDAKKHPVSSSAASVVQNVANSMLGLPLMAADYLDDGSIDPNDPFYSGQREVATIRSTLEDSIDSDVGKFFYRHGMSTADNLARTAMAGGGQLGIASSVLQSTMASSQAMVDTVINAKAKGLSDEQAIGLGFVSATAEAFFESKGFEAMFGKESLSKGAWNYFLNNIKTEGIGELSTELTNDVADMLIAGDQSEIIASFNKYKEIGMTGKEAFGKVVGDTLLKYADVGAGAILSSGVMSGPGAIGLHASNVNIGKTIAEGGRTEEVFDYAINSPETSLAYDAYTQYAKKGTNAENVTNAQLGTLWRSEVTDAENIIDNKKSSGADINVAKGKRAELYRMMGIDTESGTDVQISKAKVEAIIESSLESGKDTKTHELATELKTKIENGQDVTVDEVVELVKTKVESNERLASYTKDMSNEEAKLFIDNYDGKTDIDAYETSFHLMKEYANNSGSFTMDEVLKNKGVLSTEAATNIYNGFAHIVDLERAEANNKALERLAKNNKGKVGNVDDSIMNYGDTYVPGKVNWKALSRKQQQAFVFTKGFFQALGSNVVFVGKNKEFNGSYDVDGDTIYVDVYAGVNLETMTGDDIILNTTAHEITHQMKVRTPEMHKVVADLVLDGLAKSNNPDYKGLDRNDIIANEIERLKKEGHSHTEEDAIDEIVARACEEMLVMSDEAKSMFESLSPAEQKNLVSIIKDIIQKITDWIDELLKSYGPHTKEAKALREDKERYQAISTMWDNMLREIQKQNKAFAEMNATEESATNEDATSESGVKYSFRDSKSGMANDLLLPYNNELAGFIIQRGDYIISNYEQLINLVNLAFDNRQKKATAYFGIIPPEIISKIEKSILNLPRALNGELFKPGKDYSVATTLDSIRHLAEDKDLTKDDIIDYLDRMADTIVEFDTVAFSYYYEKGNKLNGLLLKKAFEDGVLTSFEIVSNKKRSLNLQTFYMQKGDYIKKKSAETTLMDKNPTANVQDEERSNFDNSITNPDEKVKEKFSDRDSEGNTLTKEQQEYFKDSKVRDESGNLLVVYHGTRNGGFTVFNRNHNYYTDNRDMAESYAPSGVLYEGYLNITKPYIIDAGGEKWSAIAVSDEVKKMLDEAGSSTFKERGKWRTSVADIVAAVSDLVDEGNADYDGVIVRNVDDTGSYYKGSNKNIGTDYITFKPEQFKNTDNTNPTNNPDIRYSDREDTTVYDLMGERDRLLKENERFKADIERLNERLKIERKVTHGNYFNENQLGAVAGHLRKIANSNIDKVELMKALKDTYSFISQSEQLSWEDVFASCYNIAEAMLKDSKPTYEVDHYSKAILDDIRNSKISLSEAQKEEAKIRFGNNWNRNFLGKANITDKGTPIESMWREWSEQYPGTFDAETNPMDMLEELNNIIGSLQDASETLIKYNEEETARWLANEIYNQYWNVSPIRTTADKYDKRIKELNYKHRNAMSELREQRDEKVKEQRKKDKEKYLELAQKLREQRDEKVSQAKERGKERVEKIRENSKARTLRDRIYRHTSALSKKLVKPTDKQHIPKELRGVVVNLLESINLESNYTYNVESNSYKKNDEGFPSKRTKAAQELQRTYAQISGTVVIDPDLVGDSGLLSDVIALSDKRIADMNSNELNKVWKTIRAVEASINTVNKLFSQEKFSTLSEITYKLRTDNVKKKEKSELKAGLGWIKKLITLDMLTPETYFHFLGDAGDSMFRMLSDAEGKKIKILADISAFTQELLKDVNVNSLNTEMHTIKLGGEDVKLSTAQLMELYILMKREQAKEHILAGGILPDVTKGKGLKLNTLAEPLRNVTETEITEAISVLTDEQKTLADALGKYASTKLSTYGNEASMQVYNYEKFTEENYWPIRVARNDTKKEVAQETNVPSIANKGMAQATKPNPNTSLRLGSVFDTFASHAVEMANYSAYLAVSEDVNRIRNFAFWQDGTRGETVEGIIKKVHGIQGAEYLDKLLTDIAIGVKSNDKSVSVDSLIGNYKAASVGANLRVIIQQPTAILRAMDMIAPHHLAKGGINPLKGWKKAKKYAPIAQWKDWGYFDVNTGRQIEDVFYNNGNLLEKTKQVGMWGASMADSLSWGTLWNAVESETKAKHKELKVGSDAYYEAVSKRFTDIVNHTQVVDGILQRSQIMRDAGTFSKIATSFMGEPTKQFNMAASAMYDFKNLQNGTARKKAANRLGRTAISLAVSGIINVCAQSIVDALRDDDKEKKYWEKWLKAFIGDGDEVKWHQSNLANTFNPFTYIPYAKDIVSIMSGYEVKRMDTEAITKTFNAVKNMHSSLKGDGKYTIAESFVQLVTEISRLFGLSLSNVKRDVKAIAMTFAIETDNYLMQYHMEKATLNIANDDNNKTFMDILYGSYKNDKDAYEIIYNDLVKIYADSILEKGVEIEDNDKKNGKTEESIVREEAEEKIKKALEKRMKKAEGVDSVDDLSKRYISPENEEKYEKGLDKLQTSSAWKRANDEQKKEAKDKLYDFLTSTTTTMKETREEAKEHGVDETEYALWSLALEMVDQSKGVKGNGSYSSTEKVEAINMLDFDDEEIAYFYGKGLNEYAKEELKEVLEDGIDVKKYVNFKAAASEMEADKYPNGKSIPNSKKRKIVNYMSGAGLTEEEWNYFYYEIMDYKR